MRIAVFSSGDPVAQPETCKASSQKPRGEQTQDDDKFLQQAHVRHRVVRQVAKSLWSLELGAKCGWTALLSARIEDVIQVARSERRGLPTLEAKSDALSR
jgi:hypothetical protein